MDCSTNLSPLDPNIFFMVRNDSQDSERSIPPQDQKNGSRSKTGFDLTISEEIRLYKLMEREEREMSKESRERIRKIIEENTKMTFGCLPSDLD